MLILYWFLVAVMAVGVIGAFVPGLPGTTLILAAIVTWGLAIQNFAAIAWPLGIAVLVLLFSFGIDFLATQWGAKKAGASKWGQFGAIIGMVVGFLGLLPALPIGGPLLGILLGPLLGAIIGEFLYSKDLVMATKAGIGIIVGSVIGSIVQGVVAIAPVLVFLVTTLQTLSG
jgi:hypothetical protein